MGNETSSEGKDDISRVAVPVFYREEDVGEILFNKVNAITTENSDKITGMLLEMPEKDLQLALTDEVFLRNRINEAVQTLRLGSNEVLTSKRKQPLGDIIYSVVQTVYNEEDIAAKITGMILEMDEKYVEHLIQNKRELLAKVHEAANQGGFTSMRKQPAGDIIYSFVQTVYNKEDMATKITGMILEMDEKHVEHLIQNKQELLAKVHEAANQGGFTSMRKQPAGDIIYSFVQTVYNKEDMAAKITGMILEMDEKHVEHLIQNKQELLAKVHEAANQGGFTSMRKQPPGDIIYSFVQTVYNKEDIAAKITGMILEMDEQYVEFLIQNKQELLAKIHEAANVLVLGKCEPGIASQNSGSSEPTREKIGEVIFDKLLTWYGEEEEAAKLTGMILEMDENDIMKVAENDKLLKDKLDEAEYVLKMKK